MFIFSIVFAQITFFKRCFIFVFGMESFKRGPREAPS